MAVPKKDKTGSIDKDIKQISSKEMPIDNEVEHYDTIVLGGGQGGKSLALALAAKR